MLVSEISGEICQSFPYQKLAVEKASFLPVMTLLHEDVICSDTKIILRLMA